MADLVRSGIDIRKGTQVSYFDIPKAGDRTPISIGLEGRDGAPLSGSVPQEIKVDAYLAAVGRKPNTDNLVSLPKKYWVVQIIRGQEMLWYVHCSNEISNPIVYLSNK